MMNRLHSNNTWSAPHKKHSCHVWFHFIQRFSRRSTKCKKLTPTTTDDGRQVMRKAYLALRDMWPKKQRGFYQLVLFVWVLIHYCDSRLLLFFEWIVRSHIHICPLCPVHSASFNLFSSSAVRHSPVSLFCIKLSCNKNNMIFLHLF